MSTARHDVRSSNLMLFKPRVVLCIKKSHYLQSGPTPVPTGLFWIPYTRSLDLHVRSPNSDGSVICTCCQLALRPIYRSHFAHLPLELHSLGSDWSQIAIGRSALGSHVKHVCGPIRTPTRKPSSTWAYAKLHVKRVRRHPGVLYVWIFESLPSPNRSDSEGPVPRASEEMPRARRELCNMVGSSADSSIGVVTDALLEREVLLIVGRRRSHFRRTLNMCQLMNK